MRYCALTVVNRSFANVFRIASAVKEVSIKHPPYSELNAALTRIDADVLAAEAHGLLCGLLCACGNITFARWQKEVAPDVDINNATAKSALTLMAQAHLASLAELEAQGVSITVMLPDEDAPLADRAQALAQWCQGWLFGFSLGGVSAKGTLPSDSEELMRDFSEIARAGIEEESDLEEAENAFAELEEYVRCGVVLIHSEMSVFHDKQKQTQH